VAPIAAGAPVAGAPGVKHDMEASPLPTTDAVLARPYALGHALGFMRALWAVDHELQSASKRLEATVGVTGPQRMVIRLVGRYPGISAGQVSDLLHLHPSTLTGILKRLELAGQLVRRPDPADGRRALLVLTSRGRSIDAVRGGTIEAGVRRALLRLSPRSIAAAREVLEALSDELAR
jgi:DNA-binding MarR family transcriptional regulator